MVIRDSRTKRRVKTIPLCEDILSQRIPSFFFSSLSHVSLSIFLFHSRYLLLVLSDSQCRCRRSSFGSTRLLANVPISEGRMRTTNHRRRGRGERLGRAARFCALGCFHSFAANQRQMCFFLSKLALLKAISLLFRKNTRNP